MRKILKKVKKIVNFFDEKVVGVVSNYKFLSAIYYLMQPSFWREEKAVLSGRSQYYQNSKMEKGNEFRLRRNVHRLEKGILMRPRRDVFAESYIQETVNNFITLKQLKPHSASLKWANDVLMNYFQVTNDNLSNTIKKAKNDFFDNKLSISSNEKKMVPYTRKKEGLPNISVDDFEKLANYRRSVRWFLNKKVEYDVLSKAIKIASQSPSACNRLPYQYRIIDEKEKVQRIASNAMGTAGYLNNIPTIIAIVGDLSAYPNERDRHLIYIDSSLSAMSFVYALELQGVASCIINWPDIEKREKKITKLLNLKSYERVTMLIAVGYEDSEGMVAYSKKKDLKDICKYN